MAGVWAGVLRAVQFYQGGTGLRRLHHHSQPNLRPGDLLPARRYGAGGSAQ